MSESFKFRKGTDFAIFPMGQRNLWLTVSKKPFQTEFRLKILELEWGCAAGGSENSADKIVQPNHFSFLLYIGDLKGELNYFHVLFSVENVTEVYNVQQLKQLMSEAENSLQPSPTMGIVYAFVTSFDIDRDEKPIVTSRWWVGLKSSVHYRKLTVFTLNRMRWLTVPLLV